MNIKRLQIQNFLGIGKADLTFDKHGLVLIDGINEDSPVASSNGAGKSSIFEALYWVLYGKTKRGLAGDAVINCEAGKDCAVVLEFDDYRVTRSRKVKMMAPLIVEQIRSDGAVADMTCGTAKETQEMLDGITRISELTFSKAAHFGQGDVKPFASLTDAELKTVFEQALGLTFFSEYQEKVKKLRREVDAEYSALMMDDDKKERERNFAVEKVEYLTEAAKEAKKRRQAEVERISAEKRTAEVELAEADSALVAKEKEIDEKAERLAEQKAELQKMQDLKLGLDEKQGVKASELYEIKAKLKYSRQNFDKVVSDIKQAADKIGQDCETCGREFTEADIDKLTAELKKTALRLKDEVVALNNEAKEKEKEVDELESLEKRLALKLEELGGVKVGLARLESERENCRNIKRAIEKAERDAARLKRAIEEVEADASDYSERIAAEEKRVLEIEGELAELKIKKGDLSERLRIANLLDEVLGNGGVKSYVLDNIAPELNQQVADNLNILNPDIGVEFSTLKKLKGKEEFREKFSINVSNISGASEYKGNSGGEQQVINLAISLAFNALCRACSENSVNVLFLDEPFENLDEAASERVVELCRAIAARIDNVFLISHNPAIKDLVSNTLTVRKKGGLANVMM
jgi:DNA repair exonuclease SbcCD ATPase subunit